MSWPAERSGFENSTSLMQDIRRVFNAAVLYWLSKRTTVYFTGGHTINGGRDFGVNNFATTAFPGQIQLEGERD